MQEIISTFHIDWKIIIAQMINFGVVMLVLYFFAIVPLRILMNERSRRIQKGLDDAKENAKILSESKKEYDQMIARAKQEANNIFQSGKKEGQAEKTKMTEEGKREAEIILEDVKKKMAVEKEKMVNEAKKEIVELATQAAVKLIGRDANLDERAIKDLKNL